MSNISSICVGRDPKAKIFNKIKYMAKNIKPSQRGELEITDVNLEYLKQNNLKSFAIVDGAMNDLIRPSLYESYHKAVLINNNSKGINDVWDIVGPVCESTDFLAKNINLPEVKVGDYLKFINVGAYGSSMSSTYNSRPRPLEVLMGQNEYRVIRSRDTLEDLCKNEIM